MKNDISLYANYGNRSEPAASSRGGGGRAYLLAKANAWTGVEREEGERVHHQILAQTFVDEPVGVEFLSCGDAQRSANVASGLQSCSKRTCGSPVLRVPVHVEYGVGNA